MKFCMSLRIFLYLIIGACFTSPLYVHADMSQIKKIIIWGHQLHTHTHSYVHYGFYKAFKHLGYDTYWFDDNARVSDFDFSHALFITEGQVDKNIPLRSDCYYVLHHCDDAGKYKKLYEQKRCLKLHAYLRHYVENKPHLEQWAPYVYFDAVTPAIIQPWATDLFPEEIDAVKQQIMESPIQKKNMVYVVATIDRGSNNPNETFSKYNPFARACAEHGIAWYDSHFYRDRKPLSMEENRQVIQSSLYAPALQSELQLHDWYIPCRIFKNISYGHMGITNSQTVYELFNKKIVYNEDTYKLFFDAQERMKNMTQAELFELMDFVRDHHTYLNRIETIFKALGRLSH